MRSHQQREQSQGVRPSSAATRTASVAGSPARILTLVVALGTGSAAAAGSAMVPETPNRSQECPEMQDMEPNGALAAVRQAYMEAVNRRDVDGVMSIHTEDTIHMPGGMPAVEGDAAVRRLMEESLERMPTGFRFEFEPLDVRVGDGFAVERGTTRGTEGIPGGKYVLLYERRADGCWRIAWSMTNSDERPRDGS